MDRGRILAIIVIILIIAVILGTIIYLVSAFRNRQVVIEDTPVPTVNENGSPIPSPIPISPVQGAAVKTYQGPGFTLQYPASWGTLTCTDSSHFEFDPVINVDQRVDCDRALKPITVLVGEGTGCQGEAVQIGPHQVARSKVIVQNGVSYKWCLRTQSQSFEITHRVSTTGGRATSAQDYFPQVEQMISTIK